jgi:membrane-bound lytic murein transglycosylase D
VRAPLPLLGTILLAGCVTHTANAPHPQTVVTAGSPVGRQKPDTTQHTVVAATTTTKVGTWTTEVSTRDVTRRAIEVFGDSLIIAAPPKLEEEVEPSWDMDVRSYETQERVAYYVNMFSGRSRERIAERLERGSRYEPMIRAKMKAGGLPEDMYYLALVESGFDPHAYSKAAAVGMWQFMTSTARDMGMRVDWWVDERRDPVRSTSAAVRFIRGLRDQFGSLYLAAAAYNGGPGRVSRGLARYADDLENTAGDDAFFVLAEKDYLRNETREYVPQLIAAALIAKEPARYGMTVHTLPPLAYDSVRVPPSTPLAAIAKAAHAPTRDILELNPQFLRGMTPPRDSYQVRIPAGTAASFDSALAALPAADRAATHRVETKKGDRAERIARDHGISVSALEGFNPSMRRLKPSGRLVVGQVLVIPTPAVAAASLVVPDPAIERFPNSTSRSKVHTVRRGESLGSIARRYDTTPARLMRINGLRKPVIFPGQTLLLSGNVARSSKAAKARSAGKSGSKKRSGTDSKAGARTKSRSAKNTARAE